LQGIQGDKGEQGFQGDKGDQGIQGLQGEQGIQGDKGDQGLQGEQGLQGANGIDGLNGADGSNADASLWSSFVASETVNLDGYNIFAVSIANVVSALFLPSSQPDKFTAEIISYNSNISSIVNLSLKFFCTKSSASFCVILVIFSCLLFGEGQSLLIALDKSKQKKRHLSIISQVFVFIILCKRGGGCARTREGPTVMLTGVNDMEKTNTCVFSF
jgi:hypothetical protein